MKTARSNDSLHLLSPLIINQFSILIRCSGVTCGNRQVHSTQAFIFITAPTPACFPTGQPLQAMEDNVPRKRAHYIDPTVVSYEVTSDDSKYFTQPWPESAKKMIDAAPANVSNRMRKNQTADRHCSVKYVVARLQPAFGPARSVSPAGRNTKKMNAG